MHANHCLVIVDQAQGMKPRHTEHVPESHEGATTGPGTGPRGTKHNQPTERRQNLIAVGEGTPTKRIEDNIHPTTTREPMNHHRNIVMVIINRVIHALLVQHRVFRGRRSTINGRLPETSELNRSQADPPCSTMDEDMLAQLQPPTNI